MGAPKGACVRLAIQKVTETGPPRQDRGCRPERASPFTKSQKQATQAGPGVWVGPRSSWEGFSPSWKRVKPCTGSESLRDTQALQSHVVTVELEAQREAGVGGPQTHVELVLEAASTPGTSLDASGSSWVFSNTGLSSQ